MPRICALLLAPKGGELAAQAETLRDLDLDLIQVADAEKAVRTATDLRSLGLVIIDGSCNLVQGRSLLNKIKRSEPDLPVLWRGDWDVTPSGAQHIYQPDGFVSIAESTPAGVRAKTAELLGECCYGHGFPDLLEAHVVQTLQVAFQLDVESCNSYLRASRGLLSDCGAVLSFQGAGSAGKSVEGYVSMAASWPALSTTYASLFKRTTPTVDEIEDLLRESVNLIFGGAKTGVERFGLELQTGLPLFITGRDVSLRFRHQSAALVLEVGAKQGTFYVECSLGTSDKSLFRSPLVEGSDGHTPGQLHFFN